MIGRAASVEGTDDPESHDPAAALERVLSLRQDAETQLTEASETRRHALLEATSVLQDARSVSAQSIAEAQATAEKTTDEARERAAGIVVGAKEEAERLLADARAVSERTRAEAEANAAQLQESLRAEAAAQVSGDFADLQATLSRLSSAIATSFASLQDSLSMAETSVDDVTSSLADVQVPSRQEASGRPILQAIVADPVPVDPEPLPADVVLTEAVVTDGADESDEPQDPDDHAGTPDLVAASEKPDAAADVEAPGGSGGDLQPSVVGAGPSDDKGLQAERHVPDEGDARPLGWLFRTQ